MSRPLARRIYSEALAKWPRQELRPDYQFQDVLRKTIEERCNNLDPAREVDEAMRAKALQVLVEDRFKSMYKLDGGIMEPKSQPTYFRDLAREIEEAPNRTWLERLGKKLSGMIRLQ